MTQPPDDRRPMPWESPETPSAEPPTVAWTPPSGDADSLPGADAAAPDAAAPDAAAPDAAAPGVPPVSPSADAPPLAVPATPPSPLISSSPTPAVAWTAPDAPRPEVAPGLVFAGVAARFVAYMVDSLILGVIAGLVIAVIGAGTAVPLIGSDGEIDYTTVLGGGASSIVTAVLGGLYFIGSWSGGRRATIGQRLFSIQVGNAFDGAPLSLEQAARRWLGLGQFLSLFMFAPALAAAASGIQFLWIIALFISTATSPTKQGLHDRFANSALVRPTTAGNGLVMACLVIAIILPILAIIAIVGLIAVGGQMEEILSQVGESI